MLEVRQYYSMTRTTFVYVNAQSGMALKVINVRGTNPFYLNVCLGKLIYKSFIDMERYS